VRILPEDCLVIVDLQIDFCPGGALAVQGGDEIVPLINQMMDKFSHIIASKDHHPLKADHFKTWPIHCVAGAKGAEFHPGLWKNKIDKVFLKGTDEKSEGYSAFEATNEDLETYLKTRGITRLFLTGLATDYCVGATAKEALSRGFETYVIVEAVRAVNRNPEDGRQALEDIARKGGKMIRVSDVN